jgi:hypothetical protein
VRAGLVSFDLDPELSRRHFQELSHVTLQGKEMGSTSHFIE